MVFQVRGCRGAVGGAWKAGCTEGQCWLLPLPRGELEPPATAEGLGTDEGKGGIRGEEHRIEGKRENKGKRVEGEGGMGKGGIKISEREVGGMDGEKGGEGRGGKKGRTEKGKEGWREGKGHGERERWAVPAGAM